MLTNENLHGVPLLLLANKQDLKNCLTVADIKTDFKGSAHKIGHRDCSVMGTSALNGWVSFTILHLFQLSVIQNLIFSGKNEILSVANALELHLNTSLSYYSFPFTISCTPCFLYTIECPLKISFASFRDGVQEGIQWIVDSVKRNSIARPPTQKDIT
jgi:hypothetical protein